MNEKVVKALLEVKRELGDEMLTEVSRVDAFLADSLYDAPGERRLLVSLLREGVPGRLTEARFADDAELDGLARHLARVWLLDRAATRLAVRAWRHVVRADADAGDVDMAKILGPDAATDEDQDGAAQALARERELRRKTEERLRTVQAALNKTLKEAAEREKSFRSDATGPDRWNPPDPAAAGATGDGRKGASDRPEEASDDSGPGWGCAGFLAAMLVGVYWLMWAISEGKLSF